MLPESARLGPPSVAAVATEPDIHVNREQIKLLVRWVHNRAGLRGELVNLRISDADVKRLERWIDDDLLRPTTAWKDLLDALN